MSPSFQALNCWKQVLKHVGVGMGAASFWRGAWYVLDDQLFPEDANRSALASLALGTAGMAASQGIVARAMVVQHVYLKPVARFGALYTIAMSCVLVWRGTWVGWDCVYEHLHNQHNMLLVGRKQQDEETSTTTSTTAYVSTPSTVLATSSSFLEHSPAHTAVKSTDPGHLTQSGLVSHLMAIGALMSCGVFASVLAPPAAVSVIKDLAISASKQTTRRGTTTTYFKKKGVTGTSSEQRALEYVPYLAGHFKASHPYSSSRSSMATSARGFQSMTKRYQS